MPTQQITTQHTYIATIDVVPLPEVIRQGGWLTEHQRTALDTASIHVTIDHADPRDPASQAAIQVAHGVASRIRRNFVTAEIDWADLAGDLFLPSMFGRPPRIGRVRLEPTNVLAEIGAA